MARTTTAWLRAIGPFTCLALIGLGMASRHFALHARGQPNAKAKTETRASGHPDVMSDLDDAIRAVESGEFQRFLETYAPVEMLRRMRQENLVEHAAEILAQQRETKPQLLAVLRAVKRQTPRFDRSRGLATLEFDPFVSGVPEAADELHLPATGDLKLTGLGDELSNVISEAINLLEAGDMTTFVERLYPPTEIARLRQAEQLPALLQQFKDTPELRTALLGDFKRLQTVRHGQIDKGHVAVFELAPEKEQPARTVKFQMVGRDWRLYDDAPRVSAELVRQARLKPRSAVVSVQMELIGGNWRFVELPTLRIDTK
jgi:hypothetical protein